MHLLLLEVNPPRRQVVARELPSCGELRKFVKVSLRLRKERSPILEVRKWLKKTANLSRRELKKTPPKEFLNGDVAPKWE